MYAVSDLSFAVLESQPVAGRAVHYLLLFAKTQCPSAASDALQTDPPEPALLTIKPAKPAVNTLLMLRHAADGLPVAMALRHALGARNRADALARLRGVGHASGQHYALAAIDGISSVECSALSCAPLPLPPDGVLLHTNHPLANGDVDDSAQARLDAAGFNKSSRTRLDWLHTRKDAIDTVARLQSVFDDADAPICMRAKTNGGSSTFASVLYEMTQTPRVRMRQGIAGSSAWRVFTFSDTHATP
ncbi:hypothetical protein SuNHUV7_40270 (plasmid) [Pseudoseohaeicola sp. NH-UV-7]|uniref:carcinine hydrolase/isopenicillin-N N-acyltransferase family protein n=1 Tax=Sulfitobacter sp. TBRI5 TaxID=2989732 RepID=UPI003A6B21D0